MVVHRTSYDIPKFESFKIGVIPTYIYFIEKIISTFASNNRRFIKKRIFRSDVANRNSLKL